jgi:aspartyl-tRNA(Asn)/glutamyl-tRNA(Gln) amidotransferase subunit C
MDTSEKRVRFLRMLEDLLCCFIEDPNFNHSQKPPTQRFDIILGMSLTIDEVKHIANLARLELTEEELARYQRQLSEILAYFQQIEELNTDDILPTASTAAENDSTREDQSKFGLTIDELLENAPHYNERLFYVLPIFE